MIEIIHVNNKNRRDASRYIAWLMHRYPDRTLLIVQE